MRKPIIATVSCRGGCGKQLASSQGRISGLTDMAQKYAAYCEDCLKRETGLSARELHDAQFNAKWNKTEL